MKPIPMYATAAHDPVFDTPMDFVKWWATEEERVRREASADTDLKNFSRGDSMPEGDVEISA